MSRCHFIAAERGHYPVRRLCQVLDVPASGFYAWQAEQQRAVGDLKTPAWETVLVKVFGFHKRRYGTRRLQVALRHKGRRVGRQRLRALQPKASPHAPPTRPMACVAPRTGCSTSPNPPRPIGYGSRKSRIYRSPTVPGPTCAPFRAWPSSRCWAGTWRP